MKTFSSGAKWMFKESLVASAVLLAFFLSAVGQIAAQETGTRRFEAVGPTEPVKLEPEKKGAVEVTFDLLPTSMRFNLPAFPCMVTENNIQYSNCYAETYDPRIGGGSFEVQMDRKNTYARMWIESQNDARIVVRARGALSNRDDQIAHTDIPSGSPYGDGDWVDEWYYIYPDSVHVRKVKIYSGLASRSRPFGFEREPPSVVHEFMESTIFGAPGHMPGDDIETEALTLIRMVGGHSENFISGGQSTKISYSPYPEDFGDFRDANIMVVNLKSEYRPFTIALPYGVRIQPYQAEDDLPYVFQTWGDPERGRGYATALGHILNFWHYRRTENTLVQIYLSGMTNARDPAKELVPLANSWIRAPKLRMEGMKPQYDVMTYDPSQRAYILKCPKGRPRKFDVVLRAHEESPVVNPAFVVEGWGEADVALTMDGRKMERGKRFRVGHERSGERTDLVVWVKTRSTEPVRVVLAPVEE